ncbi:MAG TPA: M23 family metallopeptidase [Rubricoccaceae bacterium]|nr:M23 family metallopeptidase [Rubricoccaceae bacterium]
MPLSTAPRRVLLGAAALGCAFTLGFVGCDVASDGELDARAEAPAEARPDTAALPLALPTGNIALLTGDLPGFYMEVDRDTIRGLRRAGWEGGQYGFVRGPVGAGADRRFVQLHEGVDIRPLHRDEAGEPLDVVRAARAGTVAYVNDAAGSAFGRYVVVEHDWGGSPVYTLYAHLADVAVAEGERVGRSAPLGRLGYTGRGIWRERAHVHFEVAMMLNEHAPAWFANYYAGQPDLHGRFFGTNLAGVDVPALFAALVERPDLTFQQFVQSRPAGYRVALPGDRPLDVLRRYPWLWEGEAPPRPGDGAWEVTFTAEGVPMGVSWSPRAVAAPEVVWTDPRVLAKQCQTNGMLARAGGRCVPSGQGRRYFALLAATADGAPHW